MPSITQIINKFNNNAKQVALLTPLLQGIIEHIASRLDYLKIDPRIVLDLASGLGISTSKLLNRYSDAQVIALDCSYNMLSNYVGGIRGNNGKDCHIKEQLHAVCADIHFLPLAAQQVDLVFSSLVPLYCTDAHSFYRSTFLEIKRVLKLGGTFVVSGLALDSLCEIRELGLSTYNFPDMHTIGDLLLELGFSDPVTASEYITIEYDGMQQLLNDLRMCGIGAGANNRYLGKELYQHLANFDKQANLVNNNHAKLNLTLELFYAHAWHDKDATTNWQQEHDDASSNRGVYKTIKFIDKKR